MWASGSGASRALTRPCLSQVCVARVPNCGRNFEYLSGEDPYLGYELVQPVIRGIQSKGVM